jgi:hypothetical protein
VGDPQDKRAKPSGDENKNAGAYPEESTRVQIDKERGQDGSCLGGLRSARRKAARGYETARDQEDHQERAKGRAGQEYSSILAS